MTLIKTLQAWCRAAFPPWRRRHNATPDTDPADLAQRVRLSGEW